MKTVKEFAEALNGREYPLRVPGDLVVAAHAAGIVIVCGASDDLMEFEGAIHDEFDCPDGGTAKVDAKGLLRDWQSVADDGDRGEIADWLERDKSARTIDAVWCPADLPDTSWAYKTDIPHETFDVMEDGDIYCRAIVFSLADL